MPKPAKNNVDTLAVAALRSLVIDVTNHAKSGHPGMALDIAPTAYALYRDHFVADPAHPDWINRDRFVLSSGHVSALLYSLLHLVGYEVSMDDLKSFRQLGSKTPGHPEVGLTPGVDATAGPLGQGIAQAVGMAIAEANIRASYPEGEKIMSHRTYCLCGDGCLEEGVGQEAISLAGHLRLNNLILIYDQNTSTLDGPTSDSMTENWKLRFLASEWNVIEVKDANDVEAISKAIAKAKKSTDYPTAIIVRSIIGYGSKNQGSHKTHGAPLGEEDGAFAKASFGYEYPEFTVPEEVYARLKETFAARGKAAYEAYQAEKKEYATLHAKEAKVFDDAFARNYEPYLPKEEPLQEGKEASRQSSGKYVRALHESMPFAFGGSADVAGSTMTGIKDDPKFSHLHPEGRDMNWGIREFAMAGCMNGILLHGGLLTYGGIFFIFSDYMKAAIRMAAMEHIGAIHIMSHDSPLLGEDGLTHQPIEQLAAFRATPNVCLIRPADAKETFAAWEIAINNKTKPTLLVLSRQGLPVLASSSKEGVAKGAYFVLRPEGKADATILATGSEVSLAIEAAKLLAEQGIALEVVSMPSFDLFEAQEDSYKEKILHLPYEKRISLEFASTFGWAKYAKCNIGLDAFGASAKAADLAEAFGFTPEKIAKTIASYLKKK